MGPDLKKVRTADTLCNVTVFSVHMKVFRMLGAGVAPLKLVTRGDGAPQHSSGYAPAAPTATLWTASWNAN